MGEMLRIRRSVNAQFADSDFNQQIADAAAKQQAELQKNGKKTELSEIQQMEQKAIQRQQMEEEIAKAKMTNESEKDDPNEIAIDEEEEVELQQQSIPAAVYAQNQKKGALDRFNV